MKIHRIGIVSLALLPALLDSAWIGSAAAHKPPSLTIARLTMGTALIMAQAAIKDCRQRGYEVAASVVDRDGVPQVSLRDSLASPLALRLSIDKAYTSAMFNKAGTVLEQTHRYASLATTGGHLVFAGGGVPIEVGGVFYGAIGVAGTPSGHTDEACAKAGLDAARDRLEFQ
ncbi:MAG: GlcG/HbpS family heme-binding protein [Acidiphilium sp.]